MSILLSFLTWLREQNVSLKKKKRFLLSPSILFVLYLLYFRSRLNGHGSYNLEKVLKFSIRFEKSLNSVKVLEKYLISLLGLEKSMQFTTFSTPATILREI